MEKRERLLSSPKTKVGTCKADQKKKSAADQKEKTTAIPKVPSQRQNRK